MKEKKKKTHLFLTEMEDYFRLQFSAYARASCRKINELSSTKRKLILYLAWHYLLTLRMIISISELSATQVGCEENKGATVSLLMRLQGDVDVPAIQVQIMSSPHARIRTCCSTLVMSKTAQGSFPKAGARSWEKKIK